MSNKIRNKVKGKPKVYCLSQEDWNKFGALLIEAEKLFKTAREVTPLEWTKWTAEFSETEGFASIIYHDIPVIAEPELFIE